MPGLVGLSSADLGVLAAQHMFAYMQAQIAGAAGCVGGASQTVPGSAQDSMFSASHVNAGQVGHGGIQAHPTHVNTLAGVNASKPIAPLFQRCPAAACTFLCVRVNFCCVRVETHAFAGV